MDEGSGFFTIQDILLVLIVIFFIAAIISSMLIKTSNPIYKIKSPVNILPGDKVFEFKDIGDAKFIHFTSSEKYEIEVKVDVVSPPKAYSGEVYNNKYYDITLINTAEDDANKKLIRNVDNGIIRFGIEDFIKKEEIYIAKYSYALEGWTQRPASYDQGFFEGGFSGSGIYAMVSPEPSKTEEPKQEEAEKS